MWSPKKTKYPKIHKGRVSIKKAKKKILIQNTYALQFKEAGILNKIQIESSYKTLLKILKKEGTILLNTFPRVSVTKKATGIRMGKGKGPVETWISRIRKGHLLFIIKTNNSKKAIEGLNQCAYKIPLKVKIMRENSF